MDQVPKKRKRKINPEGEDRTFRINLSQRPIDIVNILTNISDPNSSDLDFITDDESDYEQDLEEDMEGVGVSFEAQDMGHQEVSDENVLQTDLTDIDEITENLNFDLFDHNFAYEVEVFNEDEPGPSNITNIPNLLAEPPIITEDTPVIIVPSQPVPWQSASPTAPLKKTSKRKLRCNKKKLDRGKIQTKKTANKKNTTNKVAKVKKVKQPPTKWFPTDNDFAGNVPPFLGNATYSLSDANKGETPYYFFSNIFPEELYATIAQESNLYAIQQGHILGATTEDIKVFLAINIIMTYVKYPAYRMYWSAVSSLRMELIANAMPLKKFEKIKRFLHFTDNNEIPEGNKDIFIKIRPVIEKLNETFKTCCTPLEFVAVDEMIIPFKGRNRAKQYIKSKPKKWGFKAWVLACSNGYVHRFELYQGKLSVPPSPLGVIADTVLRLTEDLQGKNHKLFIDNLFVSLPLVRALQLKQIHVVGTLRSNRLPSAADIVLGPAKELLAKERGAMSVATSENNISVVRWVDSGVVTLVSTYAGIMPIDVIDRWNPKEKIYVKVDRPFCVAVYNKFMGGVDLADRMVAHYPHSLKNKKFYLRIFFHFVNVAMSNAWILFKDKTKTKIPFLEFKAAISESLIAVSLKKTKLGRPSSTPQIALKQRARPGVVEDVRFDNEGHYPDKLDVPNRCREKNCKRRTRYRCKKCKVHVCPECMEAFHSA